MLPTERHSYAEIDHFSADLHVAGAASAPRGSLDVIRGGRAAAEWARQGAIGDRSSSSPRPFLATATSSCDPGSRTGSAGPHLCRICRL